MRLSRIGWCLCWLYRKGTGLWLGSWVSASTPLGEQSSKAETAYCSGQRQHKQGIVTPSNQSPMLRRLSMGLLASAISVASLPAIAQEGSADDLGVMSISLKDVVKPTLGFQGALQGAGTPNQAELSPLTALLLESSRALLQLWAIHVPQRLSNDGWKRLWLLKPL